MVDRNNASSRIVVAAGDVRLLNLIHEKLWDEGYRVTNATTGRGAIRACREACPDLVILDVQLSAISGLDVCRSLRAEGDTVPIIMLGSNEDETQLVSALNEGADQFLTCPFTFPEFMARVGAILRRAGAEWAAAGIDRGWLRFGSVIVDLATRRVTVDDEEIPLRLSEFSLLAFLALNPGEPFTREELLRRVWGTGHAWDDAVPARHIRSLRRKIEAEPASPRHLLTAPGGRYLLKE